MEPSGPGLGGIDSRLGQQKLKGNAFRGKEDPFSGAAFSYKILALAIFNMHNLWQKVNVDKSINQKRHITPK